MIFYPRPPLLPPPPELLKEPPLEPPPLNELEGLELGLEYDLDRDELEGLEYDLDLELEDLFTDDLLLLYLEFL